MGTEKRKIIIERLQKVKALAEHAEGAERKAAERLLTSLMERYHISPEQLDSEVEDYHLAYVGNERRYFQLFYQIACKIHKGPLRFADLRKAPARERKILVEAYYGPKNSNAGLFCTKAEFVEILTLFEIYKKDYREQEDIFYYAYLDKNGLLLKQDGDGGELTDEEIDILVRAEVMSGGIKRRNVYKEIEA